MKPQTKFVIVALVLICAINVCQAEQNIIRASDETKHRLDIALEYQVDNPEWGVVLVSRNTRFRGVGFFVNYYIDENKDIHFHDEKFGLDYSGRGWQYEDPCYGCEYYYFYVNDEIPRNRYAGVKTSNAWEIYNEL